MWFTDSNYSHAFIGSRNYLRLSMLIEATSKGVIFTPWRHYEHGKYNYRVYFPKISVEERNRALEKIAFEYLDDPYGYKELILMGVSIALRAVGIKYKPPKSKNLVCSGLMLKYLKACPTVADLFKDMIPEDVSPEQLLEVMEKTPNKFVLIEVKGRNENNSDK